MPERFDNTLAQSAFATVQRVQPKDRKEFTSHAQALPMLLLTSGLPSALHYLAGKGKQQEGLAKAIATVIGFDSVEAALHYLTNSPTTAGYRLKELKAQRYADWLKRQASAFEPPASPPADQGAK